MCDVEIRKMNKGFCILQENEIADAMHIIMNALSLDLSDITPK